MNYYLGIDIGTTATKAVAFAETGKVLAISENGYAIHHPQPDYSEQNPEEIFEAVIQGIKQILQQLNPHIPRFISFSAAMHSLIAIDEDGNLLTQSIIWADNRAAAIAKELCNSETGKSFYLQTGVPIHPMSPLCKLLWLKAHQPHIFYKAYKFIGIKEYIFHKLFGNFLIDTSIAAATGLLNKNTLTWDKKNLEFTGIDAGKLSEIVTVGYVSFLADAQQYLPLDKSIPFIIGGGDGALSNIGTGAVGNTIMAVNIGTSCAARMLLNAPETDNSMRTFCYHVTGNSYIVGGAGNNGAIVLQWLKDNILQNKADFDSLFTEAATITPGCDGLLLLPYILGERAPIWNAQAKGVYFGLTAQHTQAHLVRAALEGVIYGVYSIGKIVAEKRNITEIHASGGFTKSSLWVQMLCDMFNTKVLISGAVESAALGAVMVGAKVLGMETKFHSSVIAVYHPDAGRHEVYKKCFEKFERLYELLKGEM